jgi:hypothetical protein
MPTDGCDGCDGCDDVGRTRTSPACRQACHGVESRQHDRTRDTGGRGSLASLVQYTLVMCTLVMCTLVMVQRQPSASRATIGKSPPDVSTTHSPRRADVTTQDTANGKPLCCLVCRQDKHKHRHSARRGVKAGPSWPLGEGVAEGPSGRGPTISSASIPFQTCNRQTEKPSPPHNTSRSSIAHPPPHASWAEMRGHRILRQRLAAVDKAPSVSGCCTRKRDTLVPRVLQVHRSTHACDLAGLQSSWRITQCFSPPRTP